MPKFGFLRDFQERRQLPFTILQATAILGALAFFALFSLRGWVPWVGVGVGIIAVLAAAMSLQNGMKGTHKAVWMLIIGAFLVIELLSIGKAAREEDATRTKENQQFQRIASGLETAIDQNKIAMTQSSDQFKKTTEAFSQEEDARQEQFDATMQQFTQANSGEQSRFNALMDHEEKLAEALTGTLVPANDPTPPNTCRAEMIPPTAVEVFIGDARFQNVNVVDTFPSIVIARRKAEVAAREIPDRMSGVGFGVFSPSTDESVVSLDRSADGSVVVLLDLRSSDGRIIAKLDRDGFVVNRNNVLEVKKDDSRIRIIDQFGREVLNVQYFNSHAIGVSGMGIGLGQSNMGMCAIEAGPALLYP